MYSSGFILIDKPKGMSSAACVNILRSKAGRKTKVGHAGTLDVPACGLLVLLLGKMTRSSPYVMNLPKTYVTTIKLGEQTDTDDSTGQVQRKSEWRHIKEEDIDLALISFLGHRHQVPPKVSAISVNGRRAYEMARNDESPELPERVVFVQSIKRTSPISEEGKFTLDLECSKGTYVRSLARDLGIKLGCYAHVDFLQRTKIGPFELKDAIPMDCLYEMSEEEVLSKVCSPHELLKAFCTCEANEGEEEILAKGQSLSDVPQIKEWGTIEPSKAFAVKGKDLISFCDIKWHDSGCIIKPVTNIFL